MKRISTILLLLFLAMASMFSQSNTFSIKGRIIDAATKAPVRDVSIGINGTLSGAISDSAGLFSLQASGKSVNLHFSILGYEKKFLNVNKALRDTVTVELIRKTNMLDEIVISALPTQVVSKSKRYHVLDYDFYDGNILMITYVDLKKAKLVLLDQNFDTLSYKNIPYEPNRLFRDCIGNLHVVCHDSIYQAYYNGNTLSLLPAKSIRDFEQILLPCVGQDSSNFYVVEKYGSKWVDPGIGLPFYSNPLALSYTYINKKRRLKTRFIAIADERKIIMSNDEDAFEARKEAAGLKTFGDKLFAEKFLFTEIYAPLFNIKNVIRIFDYVNGKILVFDKTNKISKEVPILFHKSLEFQDDMQVDRETWNVFALFESKGITELREIDIDSGLISHSYKIPFPFVNHVKVRDNYIYFIRKGKEDDDTRYLSRLKIN